VQNEETSSNCPGPPGPGRAKFVVFFSVAIGTPNRAIKRVHAIISGGGQLTGNNEQKFRPPFSELGISPHTIRHTTATHLLRSGVDINTIRAWLGHVSLETTNVYAEVDLEMKAKALANCEVKDDEPKKPWRRDKGLMEFLRTL
jgi:integrase